MKTLSRPIAAALGAVLLASAAGSMTAAPPETNPRWKVPIATKKLANGLTVVVSEDHSAPTFGLSIVVGVGFRLEPKGRTGFAHLFEHMMFQGTPRAPKGVFDKVVEGGGGVNNGSTRNDYTNYIVSAPMSALDSQLWLEADRMKGLDFSQKNLDNQRDVVKEEIRVNVKNRPYGLFFWSDTIALAFDRWENSHDGYGSFEDLDAANLKDVEAFFNTYYTPSNTVLAIVGDITPEEAFAKVEKYFGSVPSREAPKRPDVSEKLGTKEKTADQTDPLAQVPAIAIGYRMPEPTSPDYVPAAVLADVLAGGEASRIFLSLVKGKELLLNADGGVNWPLGSPWENNGPSLLTLFALYKPTANAKTVTAAIDAEIQKIATGGVSAAELARTKTKMIANHFAVLEMPIDRANLLAIAQRFGNAETVNTLPDRIEAVTGADLARVAKTYLTPQNRVTIDRKPGARPEGGK